MPNMELSVTFRFAASHFLTKYHGKCENLHGHTYRLDVTLEGKLDETGMLIDFGDLSRIVEELVLTKLDHNYLNDVVAHSTCENVAVWIFKRVQNHLHGKLSLYKITLFENETSFIECFNDDIRE